MRHTQRGPAAAALAAIALIAWGSPASGSDHDHDHHRDQAAADDDRTIRPTVLVRRGIGVGSGTILASVDGEALVLTASHVVDAEGRIEVELHRYNLGVEHALPPGGWPVVLVGELAAIDRLADLAVVRLRGHPALPFVARLAAIGDEPKRGTAVTSVGVDLGKKLAAWSTRVEGTAWFSRVVGPGAGDEPPSKPGTPSRFRPAAKDRDRDRNADADAARDERPFLVTTRAPEHGRSGGGLFLAQGRGRGHLVGVCVGRIEVDGKVAIGIFASGESVRKLLREHGLEDAVIRAEAERAEREDGRRPAGR